MEKIKHFYNLFIGKDDECINGYADALISNLGIGSPFFIFTICIVLGMVVFVFVD